MIRGWGHLLHRVTQLLQPAVRSMQGGVALQGVRLERFHCCLQLSDLYHQRLWHPQSSIVGC
jgi:hypothetical protein